MPELKGNYLWYIIQKKLGSRYKNNSFAYLSKITLEANHIATQERGQMSGYVSVVNAILVSLYNKMTLYL